jgi:hypothetical protein
MAFFRGGQGLSSILQATIPLNTTSEVLSQTFFHPDYTVGSGVSPGHASDPLSRSDARGLYRRSGIERTLQFASPCPEGYSSIFNIKYITKKALM